MSYVLTKAIEKELNKIADSMPTVYQKQEIPTVVSGSKILSHNPNARLRTGDEVSSEKLYTVPVRKPKNHRRFLRNIYKQFGMEGVRAAVERSKQTTPAK